MERETRLVPGALNSYTSIRECIINVQILAELVLHVHCSILAIKLF